MIDPLFSNPALRAARAALDGLAAQQDLIGQNIANVDTPGYRAQTADFAKALRRALDNDGDAALRLSTTHTAHLALETQPDAVQINFRKGGSSRADGNNVDIDTELTQLSEVGVEYQALTQLVSKKILLLRNIATGR